MGVGVGGMCPWCPLLLPPMYMFMYIHVCPPYTGQSSAGGNSVYVAMDINMGELLVICQERRHKKTVK